MVNSSQRGGESGGTSASWCPPQHTLMPLAKRRAHQGKGTDPRRAHGQCPINATGPPLPSWGAGGG